MKKSYRIESQWIAVFTFILFSTSGSVAFAEGCNQKCQERILAQIETLKREIKSNIPVGTILPYAGWGAVPEHFVPCDGAQKEKSLFSDLYAVIGNYFTPPSEFEGTTFRVPDLRGKTPIGEGTGQVNGTNLSQRVLGAEVGEETHQLSKDEMPKHTHTDQGHSHGLRDPGHGHSTPSSAQAGSAQSHLYGSGNGSGGNVQNIPPSGTGISIVNGRANLDVAGADASHNNMQPSLVVLYMIKVE